MTQRREKKNKRIEIYYFSLAFLSFSLPVASMFLGLNAKCILHLAFERSTANALGQSCNCKKITIELQYHSKFIIALLLNCKNKILIFIHSFSFFLTYFSLCLVLTLLSSPFLYFLSISPSSLSVGVVGLLPWVMGLLVGVVVCKGGATWLLPLPPPPQFFSNFQ